MRIHTTTLKCRYILLFWISRQNRSKITDHSEYIVLYSDADTFQRGKNYLLTTFVTSLFFLTLEVKIRRRAEWLFCLPGFVALRHETIVNTVRIIYIVACRLGDCLCIARRRTIRYRIDCALIFTIFGLKNKINYCKRVEKDRHNQV